MKTVALLFIFTGITAFSQENPWKNKNTVNPWETTQPAEQKTQKTAATNTDEPDVDSTIVFTGTVQKDTAEITLNQMVRNAELATKDNYHSQRDFAVGFVNGLLLNGYGTLADLLYTIPTTKREQNAMEKVRSDTTYASVDDQRLKNRTKRAVKSKKFLTSLYGTIAGSVVQFGIFIGLSIYN